MALEKLRKKKLWAPVGYFATDAEVRADAFGELHSIDFVVAGGFAVFLASIGFPQQVLGMCPVVAVESVDVDKNQLGLARDCCFVYETLTGQ